MLTKPEAMEKVLREVHDFTITFYVMRGQIQVVGTVDQRPGYIMLCLFDLVNH